MLRNEPRAATAVAVTPVTCELIRKIDFDAAIATMPPILRTMTQSYVEPLATKAWPMPENRFGSGKLADS
jgi:CRP-like cAMP-binding protein